MTGINALGELALGEFFNRALIIAPLIIGPQVPAQPPPILLRGVQPENEVVAPPGQIIRLVQSQYLPLDHPASKFNTGIQGPNVSTLPQITSYVIQRQYLPLDHPTSLFSLGVQPANVAVPPHTGSILVVGPQFPEHSDVRIATAERGEVIPAVVLKIIINQEYPWHPSSRFWSASPSNVAASPQITSYVIQSQFYPLDHPLSKLLPGIFTPTTRPKDWIIQPQFIPLDHPQSKFNVGIQGPNVRVPVVDRLVQFQYLPLDHPQSKFNIGIQGPNVKPPIVDRLVQLQELPGHPPSFLGPILVHPTVESPGQIIRLIQGQYYPLDHPQSKFYPGIQGLDTWPIIRYIIQGQYYPLDHPQSKFQIGIQGPNVRSPIVDRLVQSQFYPLDHPRSLFWLGVEPFNTRIPARDWIVQPQFYPLDHPQSKFNIGIQGPNVRVPVRDWIVQPQFVPLDHPQSKFWSGVHPRNVITPTTNWLIQPQFYPLDHPKPLLTFLPATVLPVVDAYVRRLIVSQEWPWHPDSKLFAGIQNWGLLISSPRFTSAPKQPQRVFVSSPLRRLPIVPQPPGTTFMPYGNPFSAVDASVEICTLTSNFDPWFIPGQNIASILSVTAQVAEDSLVNDPNAANIVIQNSAQIGVSPTSGLPNRAVLYQVTNLQPNVTYLIIVLVELTDQQIYQMGSYLPCEQLH